jgi:hypothetical protein
MPGPVGGPFLSPVTLKVPPQAWVIMSKARLCSNGLPSPMANHVLDELEPPGELE